MPKPSCGAHHKALACSLQIKSGREEWMGAEEQKALTAAIGGAQGELPKEHPDLPKPTPGPCPCAKPGAPLASRVSSCRRSCLLHKKQNLAISRLQASHSTFWGAGCLPFYSGQNPLQLIATQAHLPPPLLRWPGLSSLPFPAAITHHPAHPRGWRWPAPVSPPQHLRQSKENSSNHPAALQLLIMLISVPESYQPQKEKGPRSEKGTQDGWAVLSHPSVSISPLLPPRAGLS